MVAVVLFFTTGVTGLVTLINNFDSGGFPDEIVPHEEYLGADDDEIADEEYENNDGGLLRPPQRTNFILIGTDHNLLADAIMVGTFYRDSGNIHLMSLPRDTVARIPQEHLDYMRSQGLRPPHTLKINELRAYGGQTGGVRNMNRQIEHMLGVEFDYYIEVELDGFRRLVDAIGGVEMYIPRRLRYHDPTANPPTNIDVPAGLQLLDGQMAEGVVRYRRWPMGDIQRNEMQMEFMTQLIRQTLTREALMNDPVELLRIALEETNTNVGLSIIRYMPYVRNMNMDSVTTFEMPIRSLSMTIGDRPGFIDPDRDLLPGVIRDVFFAEFDETIFLGPRAE